MWSLYTSDDFHIEPPSKFFKLCFIINIIVIIPRYMHMFEVFSSILSFRNGLSSIRLNFLKTSR